MLSINRALLLVLSASSAFAVTYQDVLNDLATVDTDVKDLTTKANNFPTGSSLTPGQQLSAIQTAVGKLITDLNKATSDTNSASAPTAAQAQTVYDYVCTKPLYPDAQALVTATKNKRDQFNTYAAKPTIKKDCQDIKTAVDNLANALIAKAPTSALKSSGTTCKNNYDTILNDCITYFS